MAMVLWPISSCAVRISNPGHYETAGERVPQTVPAKRDQIGRLHCWFKPGAEAQPHRRRQTLTRSLASLATPWRERP
jgi:hypothetical protein